VYIHPAPYIDRQEVHVERAGPALSEASAV